MLSQESSFPGLAVSAASCAGIVFQITFYFNSTFRVELLLFLGHTGFIADKELRDDSSSSHRCSVKTQSEWLTRLLVLRILSDF